jgi:transposase
MRFYKHTHAFYGGVDLHARSMFTHILDHDGNTVFEADLPASSDAFRNAIAPYRAGLVVGCECMFSWYWLADLCEDDAIPFTLGHALYMKAIHGDKAKNDRIDAAKIAGLLRGGMIFRSRVSDVACGSPRRELTKRSTRAFGLPYPPAHVQKPTTN